MEKDEHVMFLFMHRVKLNHFFVRVQAYNLLIVSLNVKVDALEGVLCFLEV